MDVFFVLKIVVELKDIFTVNRKENADGRCPKKEQTSC